MKRRWDRFRDDIRVIIGLGGLAGVALLLSPKGLAAIISFFL